MNVFLNNRVEIALNTGENYTPFGAFAHGYATVVTNVEKRSEPKETWVECFYNGEIPML